MTYYIQERCAMSGVWERMPGKGKKFATAIEALEKRDKIAADAPNDGVPRRFRVVDQDGRIIDYSGGQEQ